MSLQKYKTKGEKGLFDEQFTIERLSAIGQSMNGLIVKSVGIVRATGIIGLINLTYNLFRYEHLKD